jgi:hypothetical protein
LPKRRIGVSALAQLTPLWGWCILGNQRWDEKSWSIPLQDKKEVWSMLKCKKYIFSETIKMGQIIVKSLSGLDNAKNAA